MRSRIDPRRWRTGAGAPVAVLALGLTVAALLPPVAAAGGAVPSTRNLVEPWSQYDTGRVSVVYPSALPLVELIQDANSSLSATLGIGAIYEVAPGGLPTPTVVAAAFPSTAAAFNGSPAAGSSGGPFSLTANLAVYPVGLPLWTPGTAIGPTAGPVGTASLAVEFSPASPTARTAGITINWTVSGWPWSAPDDLLTLELSFGYATSNALTACRGSPVMSPVLPACTGETVGSSQGVWGSSFTALESTGGQGPEALVAWSSSIVYGSAQAPVTMGALATNPGTGELCLMGPGAGAGPASGSLSFALVAPGTAVYSALVSGNLLVYGTSAALLAGAAGAAILGYRRYDRRVRESL